MRTVDDVVEPTSPIQRTQIVEFEAGHVVLVDIRPAGDVSYSEKFQFYHRDGSTSDQMSGNEMKREFFDQR